MRNEVVLFCELVHFKSVVLWCINVKMQSILSIIFIEYIFLIIYLFFFHHLK